MRFGICLYLWTTDLTDEHLHLIGELKRLGYDGVEVPLSSGNASDYRRIRRVLDDEGMACTTIINVGADKDTVSADPVVRQAALDELTFGIETSALLGSEVMSGPYQCAYAHFTGAGPTVAELERSAEVLRKAAEIAEPAGVRLAAEFLNRHESYLINTMAAGADLARRVDHPAFGILYDTHHAHAEEDDVGAAIRDHAEHIHHVQFSENNRGSLGMGQVDWATTVEALKAVDYDGWVSAEAFAADVPGLSSAAHVWRDTFDTKDGFARSAIAFMRKQLGTD
ncbi:MAG: D-psicose/D-tagatose/L-ribulose 3-epimerase [Kribbellaceae bacterium]|nr:D-psicose/D-tagatose/L-ribulose 3-epimerase [Kribbellaceae bacterium]